MNETMNNYEAPLVEVIEVEVDVFQGFYCKRTDMITF